MMGLRVITWSIPEVNSVLFSDDDTGAKQGPALQSRTRDGLNVRLEAFCWNIVEIWNDTNIGTALEPVQMATYGYAIT